MGKDLTAANRDYAIVFPSISSIYVRYLSRPEVLVPPGRIPETFPYGGDSLNFLDKDKGLFNYKWGLYSAGHAELNLDKAMTRESMIQGRDRENTIVMGDSGGYQIATGVVKFPWEPKTTYDRKGNIKEVQSIEDWHKDRDDFRLGVLRWLEQSADLSMVLDLPTAAIERGHAKDFGACLAATKENLDFFVKNRVPGKTRFLNILQGRNINETETWFDQVKNYPFEGWAFGGSSCADFEFILNRMIQMRDEKLFEQHPDGYHKRNWLHFLGISRMNGAIAFTALQRILRRKVDPSITISTDSSTGFLSFAMGHIFTGFNTAHNKFGFMIDKCIDDKTLSGSTDPWPWNETEVGKRITIGDICVRSPDDRTKSGKETKTSWDSYSYVIGMAMNVQWHIESIQRANRLFDLPSNQSKAWVPSEMYEFKDVLEQIFQTENPMTELNKHKSLMKEAAKVNFGNGLFEQEAEIASRGPASIIKSNRILLNEITGKLMGRGTPNYHELFTTEENISLPFDISYQDDSALTSLEHEILDSEE